ncbi:class I SAM-dependent methyltransferase [Shewanella yunxiaonensis]|uniref:Class I SAM-dependent methyltransferase n=2 Tax=Shewanellaceae TaxID=267890 RepID=A0ABX7YYB5_9GAMM|nr:class I SAM-dependent methyltransferase [Shewanella yunxiaonensis]
MFGCAASAPAQWAAARLQQEGKPQLLELGAGQGRDTLFFAANGFDVSVLDYSTAGVAAINSKAQQAGLARQISAVCHDVRQPLPLADNSVDACFSHMLFCMALTTAELQQLSREVLRVLRPGGLHIYTVRHTGDADYGKGIHRGDDLYENNGFIVHFFSRDKVALLAQGYQQPELAEFEEGRLPRRLFRVTQRKP